MDPEDVFRSCKPLFTKGFWAWVFNSYVEDHAAFGNLPNLMQEASPNPTQINNVVPAEEGSSNLAKPVVNDAEQGKVAAVHEAEQGEVPPALKHDASGDCSSVLSDDELDIDGLYERYMQAQGGEAEETSDNVGAEQSVAVTADTVSHTINEQPPEAQAQSLEAASFDTAPGHMIIDGPSRPQVVDNSIDHKRKRGWPPKGSTPRAVTQHAQGENPRPQNAINARDFELPPEWIAEIRVRKSGRSAGQKDKYYIHTRTQQICRSRPEVERYLKEQERNQQSLLTEVISTTHELPFSRRSSEIEAVMTLREDSHGQR